MSLSLNSVCESCFVKDGVALPEPRDPAPEMQTTVIDVSVSYVHAAEHLRLPSHVIISVVTDCV